MNKAELIEAMSKESGVNKKDSEKSLNAFLEVVKTTLAKKEDVALVGFGRFYTSKRKARNGRNPRTGEEIKIKATTAVVFKSGKDLKDRVK